MNVLVTGASRGLGLEFVRQYAAAGDRVYAAARTPTPELEALGGSVTVLGLDVTRPESMEAAAARVEQLDVLINNAALGNRGQRLGSFTREQMAETFLTNSIGPVLVAQAFLAVLRGGRNPRLVNVSTQMGSFGYNTHGSSPVYAASKAALNMFTRALAREAHGVTVVAVHPGWVQTDMGGQSAPLTPRQSVSSLRGLVERLGPGDSGQFFNWDGQPHPW